jgi:hypothetical protein
LPNRRLGERRAINELKPLAHPVVFATGYIRDDQQA